MEVGSSRTRTGGCSILTAARIKPGKRFMRTAFVGADEHSCKKLKKTICGHGFVIRFFDGIEPAKEWLVDERGVL